MLAEHTCSEFCKKLFKRFEAGLLNTKESPTDPKVYMFMYLETKNYSEIQYVLSLKMKQLYHTKLIRRIELSSL